MKRLGWILFVAGLVGVSPLQAERFSDSLSAELMRSAGLDRLTVEERKELDRLVDLYQQDRLDQAAADRDREIEAARLVAAEAATRELEIQVAAAREEASRQTAVEMAAQIDQVKEEAKVEAVREVEARQAAEKRFVATIDGRFRGWSGRTRFALDNGQVWIQKGDAVYTASPDDEAVVVIEKVSYDQYRLIYTESGAHVPVTRIK
ncbi:MAG: hypothetical protein R3F07_09645 [Opitutaceae bacterium]